MSEELQKIVDEYREKEIHISDEEAEQILWLCNRKMDISKIENREEYLPLEEFISNRNIIPLLGEAPQRCLF